MDAATSSDDLADDGLLSSFSQQHARQFFATLETFLHGYDPATTADAADLKLVLSLGAILDVYLPAPPLLDPFLGRMIPPLLKATHDLLRSALAEHPRPPPPSHDDSSSSSAPAELSGSAQETERPLWETGRLQRLGTVLWWILKVRSWKACMTHFPPSLPHLPLLLSLLHPAPHPTLLPADSWQLRYILLAHLSLVALVPFDLDSAGGKGTRQAVWKVGCAAVTDGRGKEAQAGAILVAKLMARPDCPHLLPEFLALLSVPVVQVLQTLAHLLPSATPSQLAQLREYLSGLPASDAATEKSALVRKLRVKTAGRVGVRALRLAGRRERGARRGLGLSGGTEGGDDGGHQEGDVGEEVEEVIESLLDGLEDKDTIVRWSAAKYLARLCALLPPSFALQLSSAVIGLFARDVLDPEEEGGTPDLSAVKEGAWHGAALAVAELARRGVLEEELLAEVVPWLIHATTYDPFTINHSTGSAVRDAAFYALWSLSRCFTKDQIRPWALELACACVGASVCDREVGIRRSGSAAFQEGVGRLGVYPEGIDVLSKTDFYSVGIRRTAFLLVAPQVAQHEVYRAYLLNRYESSTLRLWDKDVRVLAAQALRAIAELDLGTIGPALGNKLRTDVQRTLDGTWTHGLVLALGHLAAAWRESDLPMAEAERFKILQTITRLRPQLFKSFSADLHLAACCDLIAHAFSPEAVEDPEVDGAWRSIAALGLKSRNPDVWEGVSRVWAKASGFQDLKTFNTTTQQALTKVLRSLQFQHTAGCNVVVQRLLELVEVGSKSFVSDVEVRRNAFQAVCAIAADPSNRRADGRRLGKDDLSRTVAALLRGLDDYTSDQRGDVGSWIRLVCLRGSADLLASILSSAEPEHWLSVDQYRDVLGKMLKLAAERIDGVRRGAGEALRRMVLIEVGGEKEWPLPGAADLRALFATGPDAVRWNEASSVIPRLVHLMAYQPYRRPILEGLSLSIGSLSEGTSKPASMAFLQYIAGLPPSALSPSEPSLLSISRALVDIAASNVTLNRVFIPVLDTLVLLFEDSDLARLADTSSGKAAVRSIFLTATKDLARIRNIQRVQACMKIITGMLAIPACATDAVKHLPTLLNHRFPTIRSATAEQLYLVLQSMDVDEMDELEETLLSTTWTGDDVSAETRTVCRLLRELLRA